MKKLLRTFCAMCLLIALLSIGVFPLRAEAAGSAEDVLQLASYYDEATGEITGDIAPAILLQIGDTNYILTELPPIEDLTTVFETADGKLYGTEYEGYLTENLYYYETVSSLGKEAGFYPVGYVTKGETLRCVMFRNENGSTVRATATLVASDMDGDELIITIQDGPTSGFFPMAVLNSSNEVCAIVNDSGCFSLITEEDVFYGNASETEPATEPPATEPPAAEPSATEAPDRELPSEIKQAGELPDLETLYQKSNKKEDNSYTGVILIACAAVVVVALLAAVLLLRRKPARKQPEGSLYEAEEGTQLVDDFQDTGLRLQFRNGTRVAVRSDLTIGRASDNSVVIPRESTSVSGHHCEIVLRSGAAYLQDVGSTNGTYVNGRRIPVGQSVPLQPGMQVALGSPNSQECFMVMRSGQQ